MANIDADYLDKLVTRYKAYKKPTEVQSLLINLSSKKDRSNEDNKKLAVLLKAEKKSEQHFHAKQAARQLINTEKAEKRKLDSRKKIIWGAALKTASEKDVDIARLMQRLFNSTYIAEKDKDVVRDDYNALMTGDDDMVSIDFNS